jgi:hypothetical protein
MAIFHGYVDLTEGVIWYNGIIISKPQKDWNLKLICHYFHRIQVFRGLQDGFCMVFCIIIVFIDLEWPRRGWFYV